MVEFKGDDAKKLEEEYGRAKRILRARAGNGDAEAEFVLAQLDALEKNPNRTVTISSGSTTTGALGETDPVTGNSITIDVKRTLERSSETQLQFVVVHELGHAWRRPTVLPGVSTNDGALYFENTVRAGINWPIRTQHEGGYPKKKSSP